LDEISLSSTAIQARNLGMPIARNLKKSFIEAFEMLERSKETFEKASCWFSCV